MTFDQLFDLNPGDENWWAGPSAPLTEEPRLFGGVLIGQAVIAASANTSPCHSLHVFFIDAGLKDVPFHITVEPARTGRSFAVRHIRTEQKGRPLLVGYSSHHAGDRGPEYQITMPDVPPPENFEDQRDVRTQKAKKLSRTPSHFLGHEMLDVRHAGTLNPKQDSMGTRCALWFRPRSPILGALDVHQATIGFASDLSLVHGRLSSHFTAGGLALQHTSLDHSLWFHRKAACDDWMLQVMQAQICTEGRGLSRAAIFTRDGQLVASVAQEFLARERTVTIPL
jgi:acyl-CoA thioesterase-2